MSNEKLVSVRGEHNLLKSQSYREYYELKQEILKEYPPLKQRTREQNLEVARRVCELMHELDGPFQQFIWEQKSEQNKIQEERWAENRKPGGKRRKPYTKKNEEEYE
jgi:hypothetical protein